MCYRNTSYGETTFDRYFFEKDLFGNIVSVYSETGTKVASYCYDAWGNCTVLTNTNGIGVMNPFRYRGYYLDTETNFYYLQSRYYDSYVGRFINADGQLNGGLLGYNLFAYCENNPVMNIDPTGEAWWHWAIGAGIVAACALATVITCGGFAAAATAVCMVASGTAAFTTASTVAAAALIGSATVYGMEVVSAAVTSDSIDSFFEKGNEGTIISTSLGALFGIYNGVKLAYDQIINHQIQEISRGYQKAPMTSTPNSRYIQYDQATGDIRTDTVYNSDGTWYSRVDYMHSHKVNGKKCMPHIHFSAPLNSQGQPIGREFTLPW